MVMTVPNTCPTDQRAFAPKRKLDSGTDCLSCEIQDGNLIEIAGWRI